MTKRLGLTCRACIFQWNRIQICLIWNEKRKSYYQAIYDSDALLEYVLRWLILKPYFHFLLKSRKITILYYLYCQKEFCAQVLAMRKKMRNHGFRLMHLYLNIFQAHRVQWDQGLSKITFKILYSNNVQYIVLTKVQWNIS